MELLKDYLVVDLETTGLNPKEDKIIEIGAVKVNNGEITDTFQAFVNPKRTVSERIAELTGISQCEVDRADTIEAVLPEFLKFAEELPLCGHRILFDYSFLKKACTNQRLPFERTGIDTLRISRICHPELEKKTLSSMCGHYGISLEAHRAVHDAKATYELFECLKEEFGGKENAQEIFAVRPLLYKVKREVPASKKQIERLLRLTERLQVSVDVEIESLTKNEASRLYDRLVSSYGLKHASGLKET